MNENKTPVLETKELGIDFGGLTAVNDLDLSIYDEEIVGLIGPNGAGKTTVFNLLTKVYTPTRGQIIFDGKDTAGKTVVDINKAGIARTFQNIRLFDNMTVLDNVRTAYHNNIKYSPVSAVFRLPSYYAKEREIEGKSRELLEIMELGEYAEVTAGNLPYGAQRRLEIARAMATEPKLLLLDEPAAGMNPQETTSKSLSSSSSTTCSWSWESASASTCSTTACCWHRACPPRSRPIPRSSRPTWATDSSVTWRQK